MVDAELPGSTLLHLPNEIISQIASNLIDDRDWKAPQLSYKAIASFRATCRRANSACEPSWCRFIRIDSVEGSKRYHGFLDSQQGREQYVQVLALQRGYASPSLTQYCRDREADVRELSRFLCRLPSLKQLQITAVLQRSHDSMLATRQWQSSLASILSPPHL